MQSIVAFIGRIAISAIFLYSGYNKLAHPGNTVHVISSIGIPLPKVVYVLTVAIEFFGGLLLALGARTKLVALILALFLIPVTYSFHFDFDNHMQVIHFLKNLAIFGGLLGFASSGGGPLSLDRK